MRHHEARARNAELARLGAAGWAISDLCAKYNLSQQYVYFLLRAHGVQRAGVGAAGSQPTRKHAQVLKRRAAIAELHSLDVPGGIARELLGLSIGVWQGDTKALGLKFRSGTRNRVKARLGAKSRAQKMCALYRSGLTLQEIGDRYGLSRERVRQLMTGHLGVTHKDGGQAVTAKATRQRSSASRDARYLKNYGCTFAQYVEVRTLGRQMVQDGHSIYATPLRAFAQQRGNAGRRGISWEMNFWEWWTVWQQSGKWGQRGRAKNAYVMSRFKDQGAYAVGNVVIATLAENSSAQPNNPYRIGHPDHGAARQKNSRTSRPCSIQGCPKPHYGHGYCNNHYYHFVTKPGRCAREQEAA